MDESREQMFQRVQQEKSGSLIPIDRNASMQANAKLQEESRRALFEAVAKFPLDGPKTTAIARRLGKKLNQARTKDFFLTVLDDDVERLLWMFFMTGCFPKIDKDGQVTIVAAELDPIQFQAFKQAVAYKRGQPATSEKKEEEDNKIAERTLVAVPVDYMGASPEFFIDQGKASGLIK